LPVAVVFLLRVVVLVLLWGFVVAAVVAVRHDVFGTRPRKMRSSPAPVPAIPAPSPVPATPAAPTPKPKSRRGGKTAPSKVVIVEGSGKGTTVALSSLPVTIGRDGNSSIVIDDDYASSKHARLVPQGPTWQLEDLGSTNGTVLDGSKVSTAVTVYAGERITIGRTVLELQ
jgi:pSer/pThr/pTyr-binding forkhead associated (FHA) protein